MPLPGSSRVSQVAARSAFGTLGIPLTSPVSSLPLPPTSAPCSCPTDLLVLPQRPLGLCPGCTPSHMALSRIPAQCSPFLWAGCQRGLPRALLVQQQGSVPEPHTITLTPPYYYFSTSHRRIPHLLTRCGLSPSLDCGLREGRELSVLFTAVFPGLTTALWRGSQYERKGSLSSSGAYRLCESGPAR